MSKPNLKYVVITRRYWDKHFGNSYIGGRVIDVTTGDWVSIPFQSGHGDSFALSCAEMALGLDRNTLNWDNAIVEEIDVATQKSAKKYNNYK